MSARHRIAAVAAVATATSLAAALFTPTGTRASAATGDVVRFGDPTEVLEGPEGITAGPDGNLWFTGYASNDINRIDAAGSISRFVDPLDEVENPYRIATGPDGNLWFTEAGEHLIGRVTPSGAITTFDHPDLDLPLDITAGPDGNVWFTTWGTTDVVGRITPQGVVTTFSDPGGQVSNPRSITTGPDGNLWFTSLDTDRIGRITPTGAVTTFTHATVDGPWDITTGPDGALWFTLPLSDEVGHMEVCSPGTFVDVSQTHPFRAEICWMGVEGISDGYADGTYRPAAPVTRQAMSAFMYRLAGEPPFAPHGIASFSDVPSSHPFYAEVEWMAAEEISTGYPDGTYRPGDVVTRQAMSAFIYRLAGSPETGDDPPTFTDVGSSHPFFDEIEWMASKGITTGYQPGPTYRPGNPVTRQAMSAFMQRAADFVA